MIGCSCPVCLSPDPRNRRCRTHVHVEMGALGIQVDAAQEFRLQALQYGIEKVDMALLTHGHADHVLGFDDMRRFCDLRQGEAIPVYSNAEGLERMRCIFPYAIRDRPVVKGYPAFQLRAMPRRLDLGSDGIVRSTVQAHGSFETLGLVFEEAGSGKRLAYYTDCGGVSPEAEELARGADVAVLDALRRQPHPSHMNLDTALEAAYRIGAKRTYLIHMTHDIEHESVERELPPGVQLAYDGLLVEV